MEFLEHLQGQIATKQLFILSKTEEKLFAPQGCDQSQISFNNPDLLKFEIGQWGILFALAPKLEPAWEEITDALSLFVKSAALKTQTTLIRALTSELRKTFKPELALEKIYQSLESFMKLKGLYFFKRLINRDDDGEFLFKGYNLFFDSASSNTLIDKERVLELEEIQEADFIDQDLEVEIIKSKIRGREWGLLVAARNESWTSEDAEILELFAEQMATVFNQNELHNESLTMAQREFLLNQITTKIRESLVVDSILETAVAEIAQVMGAESCGIVILNRKIRGSFGHKVWSVNDSYSAKMIDAIYATLKTDLEPNWLNPSIQVPSSIEQEAEIHTWGGLEAVGLKSYLCCGLFRDNSKELIGVVSLGFFNQIRTWTEDEQLLLEGVAKQLEIALIQASIYQEAQQTKRQMALLHRLSSDIRDSLDISVVLGQIAKGIGEVLGLNRCFVRRFSDDFRIIKTEEEYCSTGYEPSADLIFGFEREWITSLSQSNSYSSALEVLNISSVETHLADESPALLKVAKAINLKSYLSIPLVARGKVLGTITVHQCDRERSFLNEEIEFIFRVGSEAAIAIEHAALFNTINRFNKMDPDTGLYNKKYFREIAKRAIAGAEKNKGAIAFLLIDVDHLKAINDDTIHGGHEAGDEAIQTLANILAKTVRQTPIDELHHRLSDVVGRFGGDEFMVLLPGTGIEGATIVASRIAENLRKVKHSTWPEALTCSIGIAATPDDPYDYEQLKTLADKALYQSKHKGRDAISTTLEL